MHIQIYIFCGGMEGEGFSTRHALESNQYINFIQHTFQLETFIIIIFDFQRNMKKENNSKSIKVCMDTSFLLLKSSEARQWLSIQSLNSMLAVSFMNFLILVGSRYDACSSCLTYNTSFPPMLTPTMTWVPKRFINLAWISRHYFIIVKLQI